MNMVFLLSLSFSLLLCFTAKCQEPLQLSALQPPPAAELPPSAAVHVEPQHLKNVADSVLAAENWLRNHVLAHYPATNITTIVVGATVLCRGDQQHNLGLILPSVKNLHHSLTRWGLQGEIKVSNAFSSDCLDPLSESYRDDVAQSHVKPLLTFLQGVASPYVVNPPPEFLRSTLQKSHSESMKKLGFGVSETSTMYVILSNARRKLSHKVHPFPPRPTPVAPSRSPSSPSVPAFALPPLVGTLPPLPNYHVPTPMSPPFLPHIAPMANPASPTYGPHLPPCEPFRSVGAPAPGAGVHVHHHGMWCVAKPSVPAETLQEALDFACGEGDADCEAIKADGDCYYPDSLVAHASYAFNSYWQKTKANGGTCGFSGTAMLITSDPSYGHCRFALT